FGETRIVVERSRPAPPVVMDVETIVQTADRPLPPDERRSCPHCGATLSKHATWCVWCGTHLNENGGQQDAGDPSDFQGSI
ncbi:MAG: hypothetical protein JXR84_13970, partial [Anaerolineae bacterium]|nr:hypothetical protein [Anaerolineae bacterium]